MPKNLAELFSWPWIEAHWVGILVFLVVAGLIIWKWSSAGKDSSEGPVAYAKKKHQFFFFFIGIVTLILLVLVIAFGGPYLGKFLIWGFGKGVTNTEAVLIGATPIPLTPTTIPTATRPAILPTPTASAQTNTNSAANLYVVSDTSGATTRDPGSNATCDDDDVKLGSIPFGTEITVVGSWPSSNISGTRFLTITGVCVHSAALTKK